MRIKNMKFLSVILSHLSAVFNALRYRRHYASGSEEPTDIMEYLEEREQRRLGDRKRYLQRTTTY